MGLWPNILDERKFHRACTAVALPVAAAATTVPFFLGNTNVPAGTPLAMTMTLSLALVGAWLAVGLVYALRVSLGLAVGNSGVLREVPRRPMSPEVIAMCAGFALGIAVFLVGLFAFWATHAGQAEGERFIATLPSWAWLTVLYGIPAAATLLAFACYRHAYAERTAARPA